MYLRGRFEQSSTRYGNIFPTLHSSGIVQTLQSRACPCGNDGSLCVCLTKEEVCPFHMNQYRKPGKELPSEMAGCLEAGRDSLSFASRAMSAWWKHLSYATCLRTQISVHLHHHPVSSKGMGQLNWSWGHLLCLLRKAWRVTGTLPLLGKERSFPGVSDRRTQIFLLLSLLFCHLSVISISWHQHL